MPIGGIYSQIAMEIGPTKHVVGEGGFMGTKGVNTRDARGLVYEGSWRWPCGFAH